MKSEILKRIKALEIDEKYGILTRNIFVLVFFSA